MQRVRTSLPYFKEFGWEAEVVTVDDKFNDLIIDDLLLKSLPSDVIIHRVKALPKKWTSKMGFGSLAFRSFWYYLKKVNALLKENRYDLIYFSTTQFPVCVLGAYWKKKFNVPYVIDMQDPWYSQYYSNKPKTARPPKYRIVYALHKKLEAIAMRTVSGLISVSANYIDALQERYPAIKDIPTAIITFGAFKPDLDIAAQDQLEFFNLLQPGFKNIVYIGRGGIDMHSALTLVFTSFKKGVSQYPETFGKLKFYFIGTSYAPAGLGKATIAPLAARYGIEKHVIEITDRISYYHTLAILQKADALFIPGSDDPGYTASKIFPYILLKKPLLAIFNENSNAVSILNECTKHASILTFPGNEAKMRKSLDAILFDWANDKFKNIEVEDSFEKYSARTLTGEQVALFNKVIHNRVTISQNTEI